MIKALLLKPSFYIGLVLRIFAIFFIPASLLIKNWYSPFLSAFIASPTLDPWRQWVTMGGDPQAFPYGPAMLGMLLPFAIWAKLLPAIISPVLAYKVALLVFDLGLFVIAYLLEGKSGNKSIYFYWLSPIALVAISILGLNDVIPVFFLMLAVLFLRKNSPILSGLALGVAISIKISMVLAVPVFAIMFLHNRAVRAFVSKFALALFFSGAVAFIPLFTFAPGWFESLSINKEAGKLWIPSLQLGSSSSLLLVPLAYFLVLYTVWRVRRLNFELFEASLGLVFLVIVLTVHSSPGWYLWVLPLLLSINASATKRTALMVWAFAFAFVLVYLPEVMETFGQMWKPSALVMNGLHTMLFATGLLLAFRVWRDGVTKNSFFLLSRKPFAIGIAGDSGVGKDTLAAGLIRVFGNSATTHLSGDDYHLWDRNRPMWKAFTHLNPAANNLTQLERDSISLLAGRSVRIRHYDHETGIYERESVLQSNDFLVFSGLHTLKLPSLPGLLDLSIYLDMDESLRRELKIKRDVEVRGHSREKVESALDLRAPDAKRYINPQKNLADLVFSLNPADANGSRNPRNSIEMNLSFTTRLGFDIQEVRRVLMSLGQVEVVETDPLVVGQETYCIIGNIDSELISSAVKILAPRVLEFCDSQPDWSPGALGAMQLVLLTQLEHVLIRRSLT